MDDAPGPARASVLGAGGLFVVLVMAIAGCGFPGQLSVGDRNDRDWATREEQAAELDRYLSALRDGDLDAAWAEVCTHGLLGAEREPFFDHHRSGMPRPVEWEYREPPPGGSVGIRGSTGSSYWPLVWVRFDDGLEGLVSHTRRDGVCDWTGPDEQAEAERRLETKP